MAGGSGEGEGEGAGASESAATSSAETTTQSSNGTKEPVPGSKRLVTTSHSSIRYNSPLPFQQLDT